MVNVKAAAEPLAPAIPVLVASDASSISLAFDQATVDNGGSHVLSYKLYRDSGGNPLGSGDINILVTGYDGQASQYTVTGLTANTVYRF